MTEYIADESLLLVRGPAEGVLEIPLNRPQARNALSTPLLRALGALLDTAEADDAVRCVVLAGSERVFAAGADLAEMAEKDMQAVLVEERPRLFAAIARFPKPVVAAVCGYALGGGCELAMHADIVVTGESAQFGQPEIKLGIIPGAGGTQRLTRTVGKPLAMKLVLSGEFLSAGEALAAGLVAEVTTDAACLPRATRPLPCALPRRRCCRPSRHRSPPASRRSAGISSSSPAPRIAGKASMPFSKSGHRAGRAARPPIAPNDPMHANGDTMTYHPFVSPSVPRFVEGPAR